MLSCGLALTLYCRTSTSKGRPSAPGAHYCVIGFEKPDRPKTLRCFEPDMFSDGCQILDTHHSCVSRLRRNDMLSSANSLRVGGHDSVVFNVTDSLEGTPP